MQTAPPSFPVNVDPVTAGRFGLWLLGRRSHNAANRRLPLPRPIDLGTATLLRRFAALICAWDVWEYPGAPRCIGAILGIEASSAKRYLWREVPRRHAERLADYLEGHAAECQALAAELRAYADSKKLYRRKK